MFPITKYVDTCSGGYTAASRLTLGIWLVNGWRHKPKVVHSLSDRVALPYENSSFLRVKHKTYSPINLHYKRYRSKFHYILLKNKIWEGGILPLTYQGCMWEVLSSFTKMVTLYWFILPYQRLYWVLLTFCGIFISKNRKCEKMISNVTIFISL